MNSADTDPSIKSELLDVSAIGLRTLRTLNGTQFQAAVQHVVDHTHRVRFIARSTNAGGGERVD